MKSLSCVKGLFFGALTSFISALVFMLIAQTWAGGLTSFLGESWLYFSMIIPFSITFSLLGGYFHNRNDLSNNKLWLVSFISAFIVTLYSGTIGAIFGESIVRGGTETINVEGTLIWGTIYSFIFLPFTTLYARILIGIFYKIIRRYRTKAV